MASVTEVVASLDDKVTVSVTYDDVTLLISAVTVVNNATVPVRFTVRDKQFEWPAGQTRTFNIPAGQRPSVNEAISVRWNY